MYSMHDVSARRSVVYQILKEIMTQDECMKSLWILEDNYATVKVIPIIEYVEIVENDVVKLGDNKLYLTRALTKNLYGPALDPSIDPWEDMQLYKASTPTISDIDEHINIKFNSSAK